MGYNTADPSTVPVSAKRGMLATLRPPADIVRLDLLPTFISGQDGYNGKGYTQAHTATVGNTVFVSYYDKDGHLIVAKKTLPIGDWTTFDLYTLAGNPLVLPVDTDSHNVSAIRIDQDGYIHIACNMHGDVLRYVRSTNPLDITAWETPGMSGSNETQVSYPRFVEWSDGTMGFHFRAGASGDGEAYLNIYNLGARTWSQRGMMADGEGVSSPYDNHIVVDRNDRLWLSYSWRADGGDSNTVSDIHLMVSDDKGITFESVDGVAVTLPLLKANTAARVLDTADTNSGISNQFGLCIDLQGNPHFATHLADGAAPDRNIHHLWWDGLDWLNEQVTNWHNTMSLVTRATRPDILCSAQGRLLITYTTKSWGKTGNSFRMMDVTVPDHPVDFPICNISGLDFDLTYVDDALRDQNLFRALIGTCNLESANPGPDYHDVSCFQSQWGGVLTIDLDYIDRVAAGDVALPTIRTIATMSLPTTQAVADTSGAVAAVSGAPVLNSQLDARNKMAFARLSARARPSATGSGKALRLILNEGEVNADGSGSATRDFISIPWSESSSASRPKATVWVPLAYGPINGKDIRLILNAKTEGAVTGTITSATVELGVMEGPVYR